MKNYEKNICKNRGKNIGRNQKGKRGGRIDNCLQTIGLEYWDLPTATNAEFWPGGQWDSKRCCGLDQFPQSVYIDLENPWKSKEFRMQQKNNRTNRSSQWCLVLVFVHRFSRVSAFTLHHRGWKNVSGEFQSQFPAAGQCWACKNSCATLAERWNVMGTIH
jgi:hypothetical protein